MRARERLRGWASGPAAPAALTVLALASAAFGQQPSFPSETEIVRLDVVVLDQAGHPVKGLTADDFEVVEEGTPRRIESFEPIVVASPTTSRTGPPSFAAQSEKQDPHEGRCVVIFFDDVHISPEVAESVRSQLAPFLKSAVHDGDWITLVAPEADVWWTARTAWEQQQLPAVVARLSGFLKGDLGGEARPDYGAMRAVEYGSRTGADVASRQGVPSLETQQKAGAGVLETESSYAAACRRVRMTLGGLRLALRSLIGFKGRKSLVLISEGFIRAPRVENDLAELIDLARQAQVAVTFVDAAGLRVASRLEPRWHSTSSAPPGQAGPGEEEEASGAVHVALQTGGHTSQSNDAALELQQVLDESSAYYLIGYTPNAGVGPARRVRIRVLRPGLEPMNPVRYVSSGPKPPASDAVREAITLRAVGDETEMPLQVAVSFPTKGHRPDARDPRAKKKSGGRLVQARVVASLGPRSAKPEELMLLMEARASAGGKPVLDSAKVTLKGPGTKAAMERRFLLAPGVWQLRVVLRNRTSDRAGSAVLTFEVPPKG